MGGSLGDAGEPGVPCRTCDGHCQKPRFIKITNERGCIQRGGIHHQTSVCHQS
ncbi:hypothetical protein J2X58_000996 [Luteibacter sp. 3190]|nr:hypothetical protein [Luteibacter sp. 3190]